MIKTKRAELLKAIERCAKVAPSKATIAALSHVLIEAGASLKYRATNLKSEVSGALESSGVGRFTVDARALVATVGSLTGEHAFIEPKEGFIRVTGDTKRVFKLPTLKPDDFPDGMPVDGDSFTLPASELADLFESVAFAVCRDGVEARPWLGCVQLSNHDGKIRSAAVDGSAWCVLRELDSACKPQVLVPVDVARFVAQHSEGDVTITTSDRCASFDVAGVRYTAALVVGDFPPVDTMLSYLKPAATFTAKAEDMLSAARAVQVVDGERDLGFRFSTDSLTFECSGSGSAKDEIDVACGPDLLQWFDGARMVLALGSMTGDVSVSYGPEELSPMLLEQPGRKIVFMPRRPEIVQGRKLK